MNDLVNKFAQGLPSLLGVLGGIYLYSLTGNWLFYTLLVIVIAWLAMKVGTDQLGSHPRVGWFLIELWVFAAIGLLAMSTAFVLWLTVVADKIMPVAAEAQKVVSGALVGAVTAFFATVWTKDIESGAGYFWPNSKFKRGLADRFSHLKPSDSEEVYSAVYEDKARDGSFEGWGFVERYKRAKLIGSYLSEQQEAASQ